MIAGLWLGKDAGPLGQIGTLVIQLVKLFAVPLLLFAILDAFLKTEIAGRAAGRMIGITSINTTIALLIGLGPSPAITAVIIQWPDGQRERRTGITADRRVVLKR